MQGGGIGQIAIFYHRIGQDQIVGIEVFVGAVVQFDEIFAACHWIGQHFVEDQIAGLDVLGQGQFYLIAQTNGVSNTIRHIASSREGIHRAQGQRLVQMENDGIVKRRNGHRTDNGTR